MTIAVILSHGPGSRTWPANHYHAAARLVCKNVMYTKEPVNVPM